MARLLTLRAIAAGLKDEGSSPTNDRSLLTEVLDCRTDKSEDRCWKRCPLAGTGAHHHYIVNVSPSFMGHLEQCRKPGSEDAAAGYNFHDKRVLRRLGKKGKITRMFLPALIGTSNESIQLPPPLRRMIIGLFQELTRAPRCENTVSGDPLRVVAAMISGFAGDLAFCPLLDPNVRYIVFGGNGYRPGRGYKITSLTGWRRKLGGSTATPEQILNRLRHLAGTLSLNVVGVAKSGHWLTLDDLSSLASRRQHELLDQIHVRIYASDNCWIDWARRFGWSGSEQPQVQLFRRVRLECARRGWHQRELACRMGIDPSTLSRYLTGRRRMPASVGFAALELLERSSGLGNGTPAR